jgi:hypothetical protein
MTEEHALQVDYCLSMLSAAQLSPHIVCCVLCADLHETAVASSNGRGAAQACSPMRRARKTELMAYALGRSPGASSSMPGLLLEVEQQQMVRLDQVAGISSALASMPLWSYAFRVQHVQWCLVS